MAPRGQYFKSKHLKNVHKNKNIYVHEKKRDNCFRPCVKQPTHPTHLLESLPHVVIELRVLAEVYSHRMLPAGSADHRRWRRKQRRVFREVRHPKGGWHDHQLQRSQWRLKPRRGRGSRGWRTEGKFDHNIQVNFCARCVHKVFR